MPDGGGARKIVSVVSHLINRLHQFREPFAFGSYHRHNPDTHGFFQRFRADLMTLAFSHVHHVQGHDNGRFQGQQF